MWVYDRPGCAVAIALKGKLIYEQAFGFADLYRKRKAKRKR
jgi:hypothetical protein